MFLLPHCLEAILHTIHSTSCSNSFHVLRYLPFPNEESHGSVMLPVYAKSNYWLHLFIIIRLEITDFWVSNNLTILLSIPSCAKYYTFPCLIICKVHQAEVWFTVILCCKKAQFRASIFSICSLNNNNNNINLIYLSKPTTG
jgi:hypothetical protein